MKRFSSALILTLGLATAGCAQDARSPLDSIDRDALADVGVTNVEPHGNQFILEGAAGEALGQVTFEGNTVTTVLRGNELRTTASDDTTTVACNGRSLVLAGSNGSVSDRSDALESCHDALRVASAFIHPGVAPLDTPTVQSLANTCHNAYVDGCISWTADGGCQVMQYCFVQWCSNGFSDYQCSIE